MTKHIEPTPGPDICLVRAGRRCLYEVFPGFISATASVADSSVCDATRTEVSDCDGTILRPISDGLKENDLELRFPYPKALHFYGHDEIRCRLFDGGEGLLLMLPNDIEHLDELGNFDIVVDSGPYEKGICAAFMNPGF